MTVTRQGPRQRRRHRPSIGIERESLLSNLKDLKRGQGGVILDRPIGVAGAGSIGCLVGGMCAAAGRRVALLARPRVIQEIEGNGLRLTSFEGFEQNIASDQLTLSGDPSIFDDAGVELVTVKSADTPD